MALQIQIESYGEIQRLLPQSLLCSFSQQEVLVAEVFAYLAEQFPHAQEALERCACAVGEEMYSRQSRLKENSTLVLLSPVAGG